MLKRANRKELVAARLAAQRRKPEQAPDGAHCPWDIFWGDPLEFKIAADGAMSVPQVA